MFRRLLMAEHKTIANFTLLSFGVETYARFRIPITPFIILIFVLGWERLIEKHNNALCI